MNLRDEIADIVWGSSNMDRFDAEEYTATILALVREALLSDKALEAVIDDIAIGDRSLREAMEDRRRRGWTPYSTGAYGTARSYVTAALDAVTTD